MERSGGRQEELMSSFSEQDPLNPNDPEFYAPPRLRERAAKLGLSLSQEARLEPIRSSPISLPASLDVPPKNEKPAPRQSDAGSTSSEITGSTRTALPQSVQADVKSKPALAEFQAFLSSVPPSQPATQEQSQQLLQQFLQWRKKANTTQTTQ
jgi:hypothetical protein